MHKHQSLLLFLFLLLFVSSCNNDNRSKASKLVEIASAEEGVAILPDSLELYNNRKNITKRLSDSIFDLSNGKELKKFLSLVSDHIKKELIYPENEYKQNFEELVVLLLSYDNEGYIYKVTPIYFSKNKAFLTETARIVKTIPRLPVNRSGEISMPFIFNIQKYNNK